MFQATLTSIAKRKEARQSSAKGHEDLFPRCVGNSSRNENGSGQAKDWEIIADSLHNAGWSLGWVSAVDPEGRTIWIVNAHGYGKRFVVRADEMLTAFMELERAIHEFAVSLIL
jgi:hypothetical protein